MLILIESSNSGVNTNIRLFVNDCHTRSEYVILQDLRKLQQWANDWGMKFNAKKCYLLSTKQKSKFLFCTIYNEIIHQVEDILIWPQMKNSHF